MGRPISVSGVEEAVAQRPEKQVGICLYSYIATLEWCGQARLEGRR